MRIFGNGRQSITRTQQVTEGWTTECPHCLVAFHMRQLDDPSLYFHQIGFDTGGHRWIVTEICPSPPCRRIVIWLLTSTKSSHAGYKPTPDGDIQRVLVYPVRPYIPSVHHAIPEEFAADYREAYLVASVSPRASVALSRRCLQHILREETGVGDHFDLRKAINKAIEYSDLPRNITASLHLVREMGNASVHPNKNQDSGQMIDIEAEEAKWCLEVIDMLLNYYFVEPANLQGRKSSFGEKTGKEL